MRMGPGRSLSRCYREVINAERAARGRPLLPPDTSCSDVWRQRAEQFNWLDRAEAWDHECRQRDIKKVEQTLSNAGILHLAADDQGFTPGIREIRIIDPSSQEGLEHIAETRRKFNPGCTGYEDFWPERQGKNTPA